MITAGKTAVATLHKDGTALIRFFDNDDDAFIYKGRCYYSDATRILKGKCKARTTVNSMIGEIAEHFEINENNVRFAFNWEVLPTA